MVLSTAAVYDIPLFDSNNKYTVNVWSYEEGTPPAFYFPEPLYSDGATDVRPDCPITCAEVLPLSGHFDVKPMTAVAGKTGLFYEYSVKDVVSIKKTLDTPKTLTLNVECQAFHSQNKCDETLYGTNGDGYIGC